jgi:hypothetical protein
MQDPIAGAMKSDHPDQTLIKKKKSSIPLEQPQ